MYKYWAYGLGIHSNLVLPELLEADTDCDIAVTVKNSSLGYVEPSQPREYLQVSPQETIVAMKGVGIFHIINGQEVIVTPAPNADQRLMQLCLSGSAMGISLYQRGFSLLLHASAVAVDDQVICFLGHSGAGKSSAAAAMLARGHKIVSDDIVPVILDTTVKVVPGYPQMKMSPEVATTCGYDLASLIYLHPLLGEYAYRREQDFNCKPQRLHSLYVLVDSDELVIEQVQRQAAILELITNSYGIRSLQQAINRQQHLTQCVELLKSVPIYQLKRPRSLPLLSEVASYVEDHVHALTPSNTERFQKGNKSAEKVTV
ncbi:hypothetical protein CLI64_13230 [Nostoc sp. CENA543]|uniref:hypothetical protein n=1 Tax=Nostoc sp. CENA543 TaxID=1869241 RepID=UPI000CA31559|nr:hypothetical protein [Nostoc sp. CENA543]AUT01289.1 hypothetical protein CLI64_13230 [Nostoc sp. CENA543]